MNNRSLIGFSLLLMLFYAWVKYNAPTEAEMKAMQLERDSVAMVQAQRDSIERLGIEGVVPNLPSNPVELDSLQKIQLAGRFGAFTNAGVGEEKLTVLENEFLKASFTNKGGIIKQVELKNYKKIKINKETHESTESPVLLLEDEKNRFEYKIPVAGVAGGFVSTQDLYFTPTVQGNTIVFTATGANGEVIQQKYKVNENSYAIDYEVVVNGLSLNQTDVELNWINYLDRIENNTQYERNYTSVYYKPLEDSPTYCSCTADDEDSVEERVKWVSGVNQFFNSALIAQKHFSKADIAITIEPEDSPDLKKVVSKIQVPVGGQPTAMQLYVGPNEFDRLQSYDIGLEDVVPYGSSILGTVNRWIIRPLFGLLSLFISSKGLVIIALTLIIKLFLYPLTYKMLHSQTKMAALKPKIEKIRAKAGDDQQKQQMETMKLYREYGVNPMGGCFPIFLQMPIWIALYRFFPASIEFRQASFLWATDLSSYDVFTYLPFSIPFYGDHVSLFTLLWAAATIVYTWYNSKHMDMSAMNNNPAMKYMQYFMPITFIFFFNNFAAGLSCYLFFSNLLNIGQNVLTKEVIIDKKKIEKELEDYKNNPNKKKKSGFQERMEKLLEEQRKIAEEQAKKKK